MGRIFEYNKDIDKTAYMNWRTKQDRSVVFFPLIFYTVTENL